VRNSSTVGRSTRSLERMASDGSKVLDVALKECFAPQLREDGFRGSGRNYRRIRGDLIHAVNIQGSKYGGEFAVNLGVHLAFLPDVVGNEVVPSKFTEMLCEFRGRMCDRGVDQWWSYQSTPESAVRAVLEMAEVWKRRGRLQLEALGDYPRDFARITPEDLRSGAYDFGGLGTTTARLALVFSRIRAHEGRRADVEAFVKFGLSIAGNATFLANALRSVEHAL